MLAQDIQPPRMVSSVASPQTRPGVFKTLALAASAGCCRHASARAFRWYRLVPLSGVIVFAAGYDLIVRSPRPSTFAVARPFGTTLIVR